MSLEELNEKLHGRDVHLDRGERVNTFDPRDPTNNPLEVDQFQKTDTVAWQEKERAVLEERARDESLKGRAKKVALVLGGIALLLLVGGVIFKVRSMFFDEARIVTRISGPQDVASGELTTFTFEYTNNNWGDLENAKVIFTYPESFQPERNSDLTVNSSRAETSVGILAAKSSGKKTISGKFYGSQGDNVLIQATLEYNQKNVSSSHTKTTDYEVNLASSTILLEIEAPLELASGQMAEYEVRYKNTGEKRFSNLRIQMEYPEGFHFVSADPRSTEDTSVWMVGELTPLSEGKIVIRGRLEGTNNESKTIKGTVGFLAGDNSLVAYGAHERKTRLVASPLVIEQTVNGAKQAEVSLGDTLSYRIFFKNEGNIGLRDVIVTVLLDSSLFDLSRLELPMKGAYDSNKKTLTWKASEVPVLALLEPGQGGELRFKVPLLASLPEGGTVGSDVVINSFAQIDSPDVPTVLNANKVVGSNQLSVVVNTAVNLNVLGYYNDTALPNSGPIPPRVGQETSYTFHLDITNTFNEVTQGKVSILLPTGAQYKGKFLPESEKFTFNERTNELTWEVGTLSRNSTRSLIFQTSIVPNPNQEDEIIPLIHKVVFSGRNAFTQKEIKLEKSEKTSSILEDTSLPANRGRVQK